MQQVMICTQQKEQAINRLLSVADQDFVSALVDLSAAYAAVAAEARAAVFPENAWLRGRADSVLVKFSAAVACSVAFQTTLKSKNDLKSASKNK